MMNTAVSRISVILALTLSVSAQAHPVGPIVGFQYNDAGKEIKAISLVNIESLMSDCAQGFAAGTLEKLQFQGASLRVEGFRLKVERSAHLQRDFLYINVSTDIYKSLGSAESTWLPTLLREGQRIYVAYQQCGAGGRVFNARDIYAG